MYANAVTIDRSVACEKFVALHPRRMTACLLLADCRLVGHFFTLYFFYFVAFQNKLTKSFENSLVVDCYQPPLMKKSWTPPPPLKIDWCTSQKQKKTWKRLRIVCHFCKDGFPRNKDSVKQVNRLFFLSLCDYWISNNFATFCFTIVTPQNVIIAAKCNVNAKCNKNRRKM